MEKIKHIPNHQPDDVADQKNDWKILEDFIGCLDCLLLEENTKASPRIFGRKNILIWLKKPHHIPENSISWDDHPQVLSQHVSIITSNHSGAPETDLKLAWSAVKRTEFHNSSRKNTPITEGKKTRCRKKQVGKSRAPKTSLHMRSMTLQRATNQRLKVAWVSILHTMAEKNGRLPKRLPIIHATMILISIPWGTTD